MNLGKIRELLKRVEDLPDNTPLIFCDNEESEDYKFTEYEPCIRYIPRKHGRDAMPNDVVKCAGDFDDFEEPSELEYRKAILVN